MKKNGIWIEIKKRRNDIILLIVCVFGISLVSGVIESVATRVGSLVWLANVAQTMKGLSLFAGANISAWIVLNTAWPVLRDYENEDFKSGWESLFPWQKCLVYIFVAVGQGIMAALCFAG